MTSPKKKSLSRDEALELYQDLQKNMTKLVAKKKGVGAGSFGSAPSGAGMDAKAIADEIRKAFQSDDNSGAKPKTTAARAEIVSDTTSFTKDHIPTVSSDGVGKRFAISLVIFFALSKATFSILEASGIASVEPAVAKIATAPSMDWKNAGNTRDELTILTKLDERRSDLEKRETNLDKRSQDLDLREREFTSRLTEIRELTNKVKDDRGVTNREKSAQLGQLANVYNSMNPKEAAELLGQLDVTIAIALMERMSDKRIGQILPMMSPDRALSITRMLSGKR